MVCWYTNASGRGVSNRVVVIGIPSDAGSKNAWKCAQRSAVAANRSMFSGHVSTVITIRAPS